MDNKNHRVICRLSNIVCRASDADDSKFDMSKEEEEEEEEEEEVYS